MSHPALDRLIAANRELDAKLARMEADMERQAQYQAFYEALEQTGIQVDPEQAASLRKLVPIERSSKSKTSRRRTCAIRPRRLRSWRRFCGRRRSRE
ncbi:MAG: hypothetical protein GC160_19860 [Acidobacteria bacterium]|nr:hypothetical protein [Acidobacteriota bacterium]